MGPFEISTFYITQHCAAEINYLKISYLGENTEARFCRNTADKSVLAGSIGASCL